MSRHRGSLCLLPCVCHRRPHLVVGFYQCSLRLDTRTHAAGVRRGALQVGTAPDALCGHSEGAYGSPRVDGIVILCPLLFGQVVGGAPEVQRGIVQNLWVLHQPIGTLHVIEALGSTRRPVAALVTKRAVATALPRVVREVPSEHDVRQVLQRDGQLPLVVVAGAHRPRALHALSLDDELIVHLLPHLPGYPAYVGSTHRKVVTAVQAHLRNLILGPAVSEPARHGAPALLHAPQACHRPPVLVRVALVDVHVVHVVVRAHVDGLVRHRVRRRHHRAQLCWKVLDGIRIRLQEDGDVRKVIIVVDDKLEVGAALVPVVGHVARQVCMTALVQWGHSVAHRARRKVRKLSRVRRVVGPDGHLRRLVPLVVHAGHHDHAGWPRATQVRLGV
mmetsp:Transcript_8360/g.20763  ORF Transcript_8360/g.20763 Transcript_8360/m.20763 type:complete len:389 (-) Transcript_8360:1399-2565(-)